MNKQELPFSGHRVAAYITAYQDREAVEACVKSIQAQEYPVKEILIIDNSEQPLLTGHGHQLTQSVLVWHHPENIGVAGGLTLAIEWAIAQSYDFLWTFDQDSKPNPDCLFELLEAFVQLSERKNHIGIIAPAAIDGRTGNIIQPANFDRDHFHGFDNSSSNLPYECDAPITSGSLINLKAARAISPPDQRLFIDAVDLEFGFRLKQAGFYNFVVPSATLNHCFGTPKVVTFLKQQKIFQIYSPLRHYYISRNYTYLEIQFSRGIYKLTCTLKRIKRLLASILKILIFDSDRKTQKVMACLVGTFDGFTGNLDRSWH